MVKKVSATPREAKRTVKKTDVPIRASMGDISDRAYELFEERGSEHGHDIEDWLLAEAELLVIARASDSR